MSFALSLLLAAAGAILYWAVDAEVQGVDIQLVGVILLIVGIVGVVFSVVVFGPPWRRETRVYDED